MSDPNVLCQVVSLTLSVGLLFPEECMHSYGYFEAVIRAAEATIECLMFCPCHFSPRSSSPSSPDSQHCQKQLLSMRRHSSQLLVNNNFYDLT